MKCQECDQQATTHVTEIVAGKAVEYHVCEAHLQKLEDLEPALPGRKGVAAFFDPKLTEALSNPVAREKIASHLLPALCLALLDESPEVRVVAAFRLMMLGSDARSTLGALQDALSDPDERVRQAAQIALEFIQSDEQPQWLFLPI